MITDTFIEALSSKLSALRRTGGGLRAESFSTGMMTDTFMEAISSKLSAFRRTGGGLRAES
jgi:hypothetical protein